MNRAGWRYGGIAVRWYVRVGVLGEESVHQLGVEDVASYEPVPIFAGPAVGLIDIGKTLEVTRIRKRIQVRNYDLWMGLQGIPYEVGSDEPGTAGYQDVLGFHLGPLFPTWGECLPVRLSARLPVRPSVRLPATPNVPTPFDGG